jgi:hypothetical protein
MHLKLRRESADGKTIRGILGFETTLGLSKSGHFLKLVETSPPVANSKQPQGPD